VIDNRLTGTKNTGYGFDGVGNLTSLKYPNGVTNLWHYDARNRLTNVVWKLNATTNASFAYQLEAAGYRTRLDEAVGGSNRVYQWAYDNLYRLKGESITGAGPTGAVSYAYDAVGNRTNRTSALAGLLTTNNYFDANDWLDADSTTNNGSAWFDKNGNTRTNGTVVYLYDWANRLTNAVLGTTNVAIVYNADGQRVKKSVTVGAATTVTLYLVGDLNPTGYAQVLEEKTVSGGATNLARAYTYGLDLISQRLPGVNTNFYGYDGSGSTRFLSGLAGTVSDTYAYDAFGSVLASAGTTPNNCRFQGEEWDADLGLAFHRARYYLPGAGRWLTMDTWEGNNAQPLSLHKYAAFHNSPPNGSDPSGHEFNIMSMLTTTAKGAGIATRVGTSVYSAYDRVTWLRDGVVLVSGALATGTVNPAAAAIWVSDFIPWGKALRRAGHFVGKAGKLTGVGQHLTSVMQGLKGIGNKARDQLGIIAAKVTARAKGLQDIGYVPRGNGGFDDVFKDKDGYFVVVESKFGVNPRLNPATDTNPAQMSQEWIRKNIANLGGGNDHIAREFQQALRDKKVRGMVVKTKVDANGNVLDPEFEMREWSEIGIESWNP
jgi:RHS repeat-associated protein